MRLLGDGGTLCSGELDGFLRGAFLNIGLQGFRPGPFAAFHFYRDYLAFVIADNKLNLRPGIVP